MISLVAMQGFILLLTIAIHASTSGMGVAARDADFFLSLLFFLIASAGLSWLLWTKGMTTLSKFFAYLPFLPLVGGLVLSMLWFG